MSVPWIQVTIYFPALGQWRDVSACVDMGTSLEITEAIEAPAETNSYVAPDIQLKLYEGTANEFLLSWFDPIQPDDTDWTIEIKLENVPVFTGFVLPTSLQIDDREKWAGFTAIGKAGLLARTSADTDTFKRPVSNGWQVLEAQGNAYAATITVQQTSGVPQNSCELTTGDILSVQSGGGAAQELTVLSVRGTGTSPPYPSFVMAVANMAAPPAVGSMVTLLTPYYRNVPLRDAVAALFQAAGLAAPTSANYNVAAIVNAGSPFATAPNVAGILGTPLSVIPNAFTTPRYHPIVGTTEGTFIQYDPPLGDWYVAPGYLAGQSSRPVDWTDPNAQGITFSTMNYALFGPRTEQYDSAGWAEPGYTYVAWHYWIKTGVASAPYYRYGLAVQVGRLPDLAGEWQFDTTLYKDESMDGVAWVRVYTVPVATGAGFSRLDYNEEIGETVGITATGLSTTTGRLMFTHPDATAVGGYTAAHVSLVDLTGYTSLGPYRGQCHLASIFQTDNLRGAAPTAFIATPNATGVPVFSYDVGLPVGFKPYTLTYNAGDGWWYALTASQDSGVQLLSYANRYLDPRYGYVPTQILPPGSPLAYNVDLTCIRTPSLPSGSWPMVALIGDELWWIAYSFTGLIPYLDTEGLSCADVLAQLGVTVDAFFYVDAALDTHFRSRAAYSARTIATGTAFGSTRIDDDGCFMLRRASIWYKTVKYVTVENETDADITGSAGLAAFAGTEQSLDNASRFVTTTSFAQALAQNTLGYLGRKLALLDVEHDLDGRRYEVGRTFTASINGVVTTFQILTAVIRPANGTVHVQGLEM